MKTFQFQQNLKFLLSSLLLTTLLRLPIYHAEDVQSPKPVASPSIETQYIKLFSVDVGGFRGIISTVVLIEVENSIKQYILAEKPELLPKDADIKTVEDFDVLLADFFDSFAGSSTGAWITTYLASKGGNGASGRIFSEKRIVEEYGVITPGCARGLLVFFFEFGNGIFPQDIGSEGLFNFGTDPSTPGVITPALTKENPLSVFLGFLGNTTFSELSSSLFITGFDIRRRAGVLFINDNLGEKQKVGFSEVIRRNGPKLKDEAFMPHIRGHYGLDFFVRDAAFTSSLVSGYFAAHEVFPINKSAPSLLLVDGGLYTTSPTLPGLLQIVNTTGDTSFSSIAVLSIGTGFPGQRLGDNANGGAEQWLNSGELLSYVASGQAETFDKQVQFIFESSPKAKPGQYLRLQLFSEFGSDVSSRLFAGAVYSPLLPLLAKDGRDFAQRYRPAIDSFVQNVVLS